MSLSVLLSVPLWVSGFQSAGPAAAGSWCRSSPPAATGQRCSASPLGSTWSLQPGSGHTAGGSAASRGGCLRFEQWVPLLETWGQIMKKKSSVRGRRKKGRRDSQHHAQESQYEENPSGES